MANLQRYYYLCSDIPRYDGYPGTYHELQKQKITMLKPLDPLLHSELRLAVVSILIGVEAADFVYLKQRTGATSGNLSVQIDKLCKAGYIDVEKGFVGRKPRTLCKITDAGRTAFKEYVDALKDYISVKGA